MNKIFVLHLPILPCLIIDLSNIPLLYAYGTCERNTGVRSGMSTGTCATVRMEEQMALLTQNLEEQNQQIKFLMERQSTQLEDIERRQYQMEKHVHALMEGQKTMQQEMQLPPKHAGLGN